jgi:hypothetical protein
MLNGATAAAEATRFAHPNTCGVAMSEIGPRLPTCAAQQAGSYLAYTDRDAEAAATGAPDPNETDAGQNFL